MTPADILAAAGLLVLARQVHGGLMHAEPHHGRWVVRAWDGPYTADVIGEGATEAEAWASVILGGGE